MADNSGPASRNRSPERTRIERRDTLAKAIRYRDMRPALNDSVVIFAFRMHCQNNTNRNSEMRSQRRMKSNHPSSGIGNVSGRHSILGHSLWPAGPAEQLTQQLFRPLQPSSVRTTDFALPTGSEMYPWCGAGSWHPSRTFSRRAVRRAGRATAEPGQRCRHNRDPIPWQSIF